MMARPGDGKAVGRGRQLASRADREQAVDVLKAAFVQERLAKDEFDQRVGRALASRTYADLAALTADIPAGSAGARPLPEPAQEPDSVLPPGTRARVTAAGAGAGMVFTAALAMVGGAPPVVGVVGVALSGVFVAALLAGLLTFLSWAVTVSRQRSQGPPPSAGGQAAARPAPDGPPDLPRGLRRRRGALGYATG
jgi:hypothetical protein